MEYCNRVKAIVNYLMTKIIFSYCYILLVLIYVNLP